MMQDQKVEFEKLQAAPVDKLYVTLSSGFGLLVVCCTV